MKRNLIIDDIVLKSYDKNYFISEFGDVYSRYSKKFIKHQIDKDGYHRVDIHGKHIKVHKLVYLTWVGTITEGSVIRHLDDNKNNNHYSNLVLGSCQDNVHDCVANQHRVGNIYYLTIEDTQTNKIITFCPANEFFDYCGHSSSSGSVNRVFNKNWFRSRYNIISYKRIKNLEQFLLLKGVTTKPDECKVVG